jgi:hypothetical protein
MEYLNPEINRRISEYVKHKIDLEVSVYNPRHPQNMKKKYVPRQDNSRGLNMLKHKGLGNLIQEDNYD